MTYGKPPNQEEVGSSEIKNNEEGNNVKRHGELSQGHSAVLAAVIIIFIIDLLGIIFTFFAGEEPGTRVFPSNYHLAFSVIIDIFLGINLLRGRRWARTWMLVRLVLGIVVWGIVFAVQGDSGSLLLNTGVLIALILLLTGTSTRLRLAGGILFAVVAFIGGMILSFMAFATGLPTTPGTSMIPESYSTYTSEGFFSISYPSDWTPVMSIVAEAEKQMKQYLKDIGMESQASEGQLVFLGKNMAEDDDFAIVSVSVEPSSIWPLESMVEIFHQWSIQNIDRYIEHSRVKTKIGGRNAIIQIYQGNDVDSYFTGYTAAYVAGDKFLWTVACVCDGSRLDYNLDTFDKVVRSLRVEY